MPLNIMNMLAVKMLAEQQNRKVDPGLLLAAAVLPGVAGIAVPLIAAQHRTEGGGGTTYTEVPKVLEQSSEEAADAIKERGLKIEVVEASHMQYDENIVFKQTPAPGENVPTDTVVKIHVSKESGRTAKR